MRWMRRGRALKIQINQRFGKIARCVDNACDPHWCLRYIVDQKIGKAGNRPKTVSLRGQIQPHPTEFRFGPNQTDCGLYGIAEIGGCHSVIRRDAAQRRAKISFRLRSDNSCRTHA